MNRVLVTGASGFIGCRVAERLCLEQGVEVRALIHTYGRSARVARLPVELAQGDLMDLDSLRRATSGCDAVVHCAVGSGGLGASVRQVTIRGTANIAKAAAEVGVDRFVHMSSTVVYGWPASGIVNEEAPCRRTGDSYGDAKIDAEKAVLRWQRSAGLPAVILRPSIVFGPHSQMWTVRPLLALRAGEILLVGDGDGLANTIYIDNLVDAVLLALEREEAVGHCFNISADDGVTWREFYGAYAQMLGLDGVPVISRKEYKALVGGDGALRALGRIPRELMALAISQEARALAEKAVRHPGLYTLAKLLARLVPSGVARQAITFYREAGVLALPPPASQLLPDQNLWRLYASRVRYDIGKARSLLGFRPAIGFQEAMERTRCWATFARLVPGGEGERWWA